MNDPLGLEASGLPPELIAQLTGSRSRKLIAEALLKQSMQAPEVAQPKGRFQGVVSPLEHLAKLTGGVVARGNIDRETAAQAGIGQEAERGRNAALDAYLAEKVGKQGVPYMDTTGTEEGGMTSGVAGDPRRAIENAQRSPYLRNSPFIRDERSEIARNEGREDQQAFLKAQKEMEIAARNPVRDPEAVRLAQIANDPRRPPAERQAAGDALKKMTTSGPLTQVNVNSPIDNFKNEATLRAEWEKKSEGFLKVRDAFGQVRDSLSGDITAPATLAAATKFMKMLDPESVVRESELNMALKSTGMLDRFMNLHNIVLKGQILTPTQAAEIQRIAGILYQTAEGGQKKLDGHYQKLATDYKLDPSRIIRDLSLPAPAKAQAGGGAKPAAGVPAGVQPAVWAVMTPEEKALWPN